MNDNTMVAIVIIVIGSIIAMCLWILSKLN
jgi:hypothetical protein